MYKEFFGLQAYPFNVNPDPRFLIHTRDTEEALACMKFGIEQRRGFVLLTGEVGTGKTTLLNQLLEGLRRDQVATAFIFYPRVTVYQFLDFIVTDFGIRCESRQKSQMLLHLNDWLLERFRAGKTAVLVVDEAQTLSHEVLEEIRLLTNLETATEKLLQIVLSGQPELEEILNQTSLRQLRQRITLRCHTSPLTLQETQLYITERLKIAGANGEATFTPEAIEAIYRYSQGIPRVVNVLCEQSLIASFADQRKPVPSSSIEGAAREFSLDKISPIGKPRSAKERPVNPEAGPSPGYEFRSLLSRLRESLK
jgi:general secretion pathway protein A